TNFHNRLARPHHGGERVSTTPRPSPMIARSVSLRRCAAPTLLCFAVLVFQAGCGGPSLTLYPVEGKVTVDGKPLSSGRVAFHPDAKKGNSLKKILGGEIGSDSPYRIYTDGQPGAPAGWYKVTVVSSTVPDSSKPDKGKSFVARQYADPSMTPLG